MYLYRTLPLTVEPCTGVLSPGSSTSVSVRLQAAEAGAVAGELAVAVAGRAEPYRLAVNATVVNATVELVDPGSSSAITEVGSVSKAVSRGALSG
jgi:hypothetical protein